MRSWGLKPIIVFAGLAIAAVGVVAFAVASETTDSQWVLKAQWSDSCSCKAPCPCMFGSGSTEEFCEGSSLLEVSEGHYGGVDLAGVTAMVTYRVGKYERIYVADTATPEQAEAMIAVIPLAVPFMGMGEVEVAEVAPVSFERTETMIKYSSPESSVHTEIVIGENGEPLSIENLPLKGLPFPEFHDHVQFKAVVSKHD